VAKSLYPPGATNANWFSVFNAVSFQITLGSPMILYAKSLGATATVLGVIAALTPLLTIAQIPAARFLVNTGYRKFIFRGWGSRTLVVFVIAAVPLFTFLNNVSKIALLLFCLFIFNLLRGFSSGAWLPWITDLIPENVRGRFLSRDQTFQNLGGLFSLLLCAAILRGHALPWQFSLIFLVSALGGAVSLLFLLRIPDIEARETLVKSNMRVPWKEIVTFPPFLRLVIFTLLWVFTVGAVGVFSVAFLKSKIGFSESSILVLTALFFLGAIAALPITGRLIDRTGSKAVLQADMALVLVYHVFWWLIAARVFTPPFWIFGALSFFNGIAGANFGLAHTRLTMNTMPPMGRTHFFAFFTVITSVGLGVSPVIWGMVIDGIGEREWWIHALSWNRYSIFYGAVVTLLLIVFAYSFALHEQRGTKERVDRRDTVFRNTLRQLLRLWQR